MRRLARSRRCPLATRLHDPGPRSRSDDILAEERTQRAGQYVRELVLVMVEVQRSRQGAWRYRMVHDGEAFSSDLTIDLPLHTETADIDAVAFGPVHDHAELIVSSTSQSSGSRRR